MTTTIAPTIMDENNLILIDCLGTNDGYLVVDNLIPEGYTIWVYCLQEWVGGVVK